LQFGRHFLYALIFIAFVVTPMALGFFLLIAVHKRQLRRMGIWWVCEIGLLTLYINLFIVGLYGISWKTLLNLFLHSAFRILGLKIIYNYMVSLDSEISSINKVSASRSRGGDRSEIMVNVPLDDPWSQGSGEPRL